MLMVNKKASEKRKADERIRGREGDKRRKV